MVIGGGGYAVSLKSSRQSLSGTRKDFNVTNGQDNPNVGSGEVSRDSQIPSSNQRQRLFPVLEKAR